MPFLKKYPTAKIWVEEDWFYTLEDLEKILSNPFDNEWCYKLEDVTFYAQFERLSNDDRFFLEVDVSGETKHKSKQRGKQSGRFQAL